ncbi:ATP-binding protein [Roseicyclus sp. F158]|uniref:histidine kinase n=1 Tax=Tropicimonas omnivorans TaxID=3075590 RepID=A0ABU3DD43_9RHOB|nr:ATP-binding protein [Roseicyclus sp. F158]MDT0681641.1 ATP-binding protein [Roseicyclus sp. F158]
MAEFAGSSAGKAARKGGFGIPVAMGAVVLCLALVVTSAVLLLREIDAVSQSTSDNIQWGLAQAETEALALALTLARAEQGRGDLEDVRLKFDLLYSRINDYTVGRSYAELRSEPAYAALQGEVVTFLQDAVPLVDGPDTELTAALPELHAATMEVRGAIRAFAVDALHFFADASDDRRSGLRSMLWGHAGVLGVILVGLVLVSWMLWRMGQAARSHALDVQRAGARTRMVVDASLDAIIVTDETGRIEEFNPAAQRIFGHARDIALGQLAQDLLYPPDVAESFRTQKFAFEDEQDPQKKLRIETRALDSTGRVFPAELSVVRAEGGRQFVSHIRDISRRKADMAYLTEARERALAGERTKAEFLAVMSHEMRTPLNGLLGCMQLMRDQALSPGLTALLDRMKFSGDHLLSIVNDVLDLSKYEAGKMELESERFGLTELLDGVIETAAPMAEAAGTRIGWHWIGERAESAVGDVRRLRQVLLNLVGNAVKFTADGTVSVEVERLPCGVTEFRVIDTGVGITEANLGKIFNDFETLDGSYTRAAGGTGLGLGIARRLTELMGGDIDVESTFGEGSCFRLRVPLELDSGDEEAEATGPAGGQIAGPLDLLLVEDNEINRFVARAMLEADGHRVIEAPDGRVGVEMAGTRRFDVILMDISMPVMDGPTAARAIREGSGPCAATPIVAVTAHALPEEIARFSAAGMEHWVSKPIDRAELLTKLADIVADAPARPERVRPGPGATPPNAAAD